MYLKIKTLYYQNQNLALKNQNLVFLKSISFDFLSILGFLSAAIQGLPYCLNSRLPWKYDNSNWLDVNLNDQKTSDFYWCIQGMFNFPSCKVLVIKSNCQVPNSFFCYKCKFYLSKIEFCKIEKEDTLIILLSAWDRSHD